MSDRFPRKSKFSKEIEGFAFRNWLETPKNVNLRAAPAAGCRKERFRLDLTEILKISPPIGGKISPHILEPKSQWAILVSKIENSNTR